MSFPTLCITWIAMQLMRATVRISDALLQSKNDCVFGNSGYTGGHK